MAETLEDYDFAGSHGNAKYPWAEWSDGRIVKLTRGEDFDVEPAVMRGQVIVRARKDGLKFRTNVKGDDVIFTFQAPDETDEAFESRTAAAGLRA
jgi:hypothetical protein